VRTLPLHLSSAVLVVGSLCLAGCPGRSGSSTAPTPKEYVDPDGPRRPAIEAQVKPFLDHEIVKGIVVGIYDGGRREIYGFGKGPNNQPPNGKTLFELGPVSTIYTSLLLADAVQRREVALDKPVAELLPPGVTVPTFQKKAITLGALALHVSGLPPIPPSVAAKLDKPDRFGDYTEDRLYADLVHTQLRYEPGTRLIESTFGSGLLGFVLGRKIGTGFRAALAQRVLRPLGTTDTFIDAPPADAASRRAKGTNDDLVEQPLWTWGVLAGGGGLVSDAQDLLSLVDAEIDAAGGSKAPLRPAMRLTQESQLDGNGANLALGWRIDGFGRYFRNGNTAGFHAFVSFDVKSRRGVVVLANTSVSILDRLAANVYKVLEGAAVDPIEFPSADQLVALAGNYDLAGTKVQVLVNNKRLYVDGEGVRQRLVPMTPTEFWIEELPAVVVFEKGEGDTKDKFVRMVIAVGGQRINAVRTD